jgi:hypothetical protein
MDIKTFVRTVDNLEQWNPLMKGEFPIRAELLREQVFPAFQFPIPDFSQDEYSLGEFLYGARPPYPSHRVNWR